MKYLLIALFINPFIGYSQKMGITQQVVHSTIKIVSYRDTIKEGVKTRIMSNGTGFFFEFNIDGFSVPVIVTNTHVINRANTGFLKFTEMDADSLPNFGKMVTIEISDFGSKWLRHPTEDLAIFPLASIMNQQHNINGKQVFYRTFGENNIPSKEMVKTLNYIEDVIMIGYPTGLYDEKNNLPIVRKGITATPASIDYEDKPKFLLDIPVYQGSSGSPIILLNQGSFSNMNGITVGSRFALLGINVEAYTYSLKGELLNSESKNKQLTSTDAPINIAVIIKASQLLIFKPLISKIIHSK